MTLRLLVEAVAAVSVSACTATATHEPAGGRAVEAACSPVERPPVQAGEHLIGDREPPVPYSSRPPTSGWHASGAFSITVHAPDEPLPEPTQVSVLEAGGVVVTYRDVPDADRAALEDHVEVDHAGRVAVTPYDQLQPGQVAFAAWATLQRCDGLDLSALDAFVAAHADEEPDVPGGH
jgi:hypothetical protein